MYNDNYRRNLIKYWRQFYPKWTIPEGYHVHHIKPKCTFNDSDNPLIHHPKNLIALHPDDHISIHKCRGDKPVVGMLMSIKGRVISDATRLKLVKARNTRGPLSDETKRKIGLAHKGKKRTIQDRQKQSASIMGKHNHMYGEHHTVEAKRKISIANAGKTRTEEFKKARSKLSAGKNNGMHGKRHNESTKTLMSEQKQGENNPQFVGWYITPFGKLVSSTHQKFMTPSCLKNYCINSNKIITLFMFRKSKYLQNMGSDVMGKTLNDIGFSFEPKEKI